MIIGEPSASKDEHCAQVNRKENNGTIPFFEGKKDAGHSAAQPASLPDCLLRWFTP
jgi:hypothetical protein